MLDVRNLSFSYARAQRAALEHVSVSCSRGRWLSLVGPNGCGKSTLLSVIAGCAGKQRVTCTWVVRLCGGEIGKNGHAR